MFDSLSRKSQGLVCRCTWNFALYARYDVAHHGCGAVYTNRRRPALTFPPRDEMYQARNASAYVSRDTRA